MGLAVKCNTLVPQLMVQFAEKQSTKQYAARFSIPSKSPGL